MNKKLIPGGIYTINNNGLYFIFIKETVNNFNSEFKHYLFFMSIAHNQNAKDIWEDLHLRFSLESTDDLLKSKFEFIDTEEEMFKKIDGFLGIIPTELKEKLDEVFEKK